MGNMNLEPEIIYEDESFLAVNKPAGLIVHEARSTKHVAGMKEPTLVDWLLEHYPEVKAVGDPVKLPNGNYGASDPMRPGIVHRLDRDTSGVILVARNQKYFEYLKSLFKERKIKKTYLALVYGVFKEKQGVIDRPLGIKSGTTKRTIHSDKMAKEAVTEYRVIKNLKIQNFKSQINSKSEARNSKPLNITLLEVYPLTGRTHQIRVHLASIGHPIVGDKIYGPKHPLDPQSSILDPRLMLHALSLEFETEPGKSIKIEASPPHQFQGFLGVDHPLSL